MSSRETILGRIRAALSDRPAADVPAVPEVWPETDADRATMLARFGEEIEAVQGELRRCGSIDEARAGLAKLVGELSCSRLGAVDRPLARELVEGLAAAQVAWVDDQWDKTALGRLDAALVTADLLLADTGSCVVECRTAEERMMCYLPPVCIVAARAGSLREHLPAAWQDLVPRIAEPDRRGEFVIVTGPSRTADIEKILILGVHGPKRLVVFVVE
ncbi:MAG TPA: LUD domain-containing protein [Thermoguttaceae bacterium]|nr:LUD domain-containing protein [Thermoguttaceae bacterium]